MQLSKNDFKHDGDVQGGEWPELIVNIGDNGKENGNPRSL